MKGSFQGLSWLSALVSVSVSVVKQQLRSEHPRMMSLILI